MKYFKNKKILIVLSIFMLSIGAFIIAAKKSSNNYNNRDKFISTNILIGMTEKPLISENENKNPLLFNTTDEMILFYSKVFMVKYDVIYDKVIELININKKAFDEEYILDNVKYLSKEEAILKTIYKISKKPSDYNLSNISTTNYELVNFKPEELVYKFSTVLDVNPNIALAIAYCECGYKLKSYNFVKKHNIGGIRGSKGFASYKNEAYGIFRFILMLHDGYKVSSTSSNDKIVSMSKKYSGGSQNWINVVTNYYNDLNNKGFEYYYNKSNHDRNLEIPYINKN